MVAVCPSCRRAIGRDVDGNAASRRTPACCRQAMRIRAPVARRVVNAPPKPQIWLAPPTVIFPRDTEESSRTSSSDASSSIRKSSRLKRLGSLGTRKGKNDEVASILSMTSSLEGSANSLRLPGGLDLPALSPTVSSSDSSSRALSTPSIAARELPSTYKPLAAVEETSLASVSTTLSSEFSQHTKSTTPTTPDLGTRFSVDEASRRTPAATPFQPLNVTGSATLRSHATSAYVENIPASRTLARASSQLSHDLDGRLSSRMGDAESTTGDWFRIRGGQRYAPEPMKEGRKRAQPGPYTREGQDFDAINASIAQEVIGGISLIGSTAVEMDGPAMQEAARQVYANCDPPRRVLDVGSGLSASWCIAAAQQKGWEETEFVALDIAPSSVDPSWLPEDIGSRISFVQHDMLDRPWPFEDGAFDLVRCSNIASAIEEDQWFTVVEEVARVLGTEGLMELHQTSRPVEESFLSFDDDDNALGIENLNKAAAASHDRWARASFPLAIIPSALVVDLKSVWPGPRVIYGDADAESIVDPRRDEAERVLLAAHARYMESCTSVLMDDYFSTAPPEEEVLSWSDAQALGDDVLDGYLQKAGIGELLDNRFGWRCEMDRQAEDKLERIVELLGAERHNLLDSPGGHSARVRDVERALSKAQADLNGCRRRLRPERSTSSRGQTEVASFIGSKK